MDRTLATALGAGALAALLCVPGCGRREPTAADAYAAAPRRSDAIELEVAGRPVVPLRIALAGETLFVAARGVSGLLMFDAGSFRHLGSVPLRTTPEVSPGALAVASNAFAVGDHSRGLVAFFDRSGRFRNAFGTLPDGATPLSPLSMTEYGGVLYVADVAVRRVLAISMADAEGITEFGELVLTIPVEEEPPLGFPSAVFVTPDGRVLVGDAEGGVVDAFSCTGHRIYRFEPVPGGGRFAPQAMAMDDLWDPSLQDTASFDPSGVRALGRIHVVDAVNGRVHMFNPLGRYVSSYPGGRSRLSAPSDVVIDWKRRRVIVCDPPAARLVTFRYGT